MPEISLEDKYEIEDGRVFLSGSQSLVRIVLDQRRRDAAAGLKTAGFVSGYRGSPLAAVDYALWQAGKQLAHHDIHFEPGLNEEIAATAVAGSQRAAEFGSRYQGVFGLWYAKNPGVDRAADALKHANAEGTSAYGGVLAVAGDDPGANSSSLPNQCDQAFIAALIPVLSPSTLEEVLSFGLTGIAMSRYAGLWVGLKAVADTIECTASIAVHRDQPLIVRPTDFELPDGGLNARWPDDRWRQDERLLRWRLPAVRAFARANRLDRVIGASSARRFGIVASGKAYGDVRAALDELGIDETVAAAIGLVIYKIGLVWPVEPAGLRAATAGLEEVIVVEERRAVIEPQLKDLAYNWPTGTRPRVVGKFDDTGRELLPEEGELSPLRVAAAIGRRLERTRLPAAVIERLRAIESRLQEPPATAQAARVPHFCAGCPHATSTRVPAGSVAIAGIGCHSLRVWMADSHTSLLPQMGGEGASWIGIAPFTETRHVFQNLGDGTYAHSGSLVIRAAVAAGRPITFRILYNGATAMTGGQPVEGSLSVAAIVRQLAAEGVGRIAVVADQHDKYPVGTLPPETSVHHRDDLDALQRSLREFPGVSALIYDQVCATEKRRQRKRGTTAQSSARPFINARVCEGCGDCSVQSECVAVLPLETPLGRKRQIDQSSCNVDLSCLKGFCPSFVTIEGATLRRNEAGGAPRAMPDPPELPPVGNCDLLITGIGGTGVMTIGAVAGMAAHLAGLSCSVLDNTGMARKGGAVSSHVRISTPSGDIRTARIPSRRASVLLACDLLAATDPATLATINQGVTHVIANANLVPTAEQRLDPDGETDANPPRSALVAAAGPRYCVFVQATDIAECLLGDAIFANMVMFGFAFQQGYLPVPLAAIDAAIGLNGAQVEQNRRAFAWGRLAAHDPTAVAVHLGGPSVRAADESLEAITERRASYLTAYQNAAYAGRYVALVSRARDAERLAGADGDAFARGVAEAYFRLLAIKDEYEVARLYSDGDFARSLREHFDGDFKIRYHLAPPLISKRNPVTGVVAKRTFGPWIGHVFRLLTRLRRLRGTWLDPFGRTAERRLERQLIADYEALAAELIGGLRRGNVTLAAQIARAAERVRGYGHVKAENAGRYQKLIAELMPSFRATH